jgi:hypothetical protein
MQKLFLLVNAMIRRMKYAIVSESQYSLTENLKIFVLKVYSSNNILRFKKYTSK